MDQHVPAQIACQQILYLSLMVQLVAVHSVSQEILLPKLIQRLLGASE